MNLVCFDYRFFDNWFANWKNHFHHILDLELSSFERQDPPRVFAAWHSVKIFPDISSRHSAFYVAFLCFK